MSSVYNLEPPTKGKVVLTTTLGDLDIELWSKEAPKAVRNFVQLCLEGYYNGSYFHRVIKDFMIQGGDPSGTGKGGESIYGEYFPDEFHSRIRFNHRGLVACANAGKPNTNNSQFFITLDRCDWLDKKNTIFGKITGHTVYNLAKIGDLAVDKDDKPLEPPKVVKVEVLWNPFEDIVPRIERIASGEEAGSRPEEDEEPKPKKKGTKNLALLSFGGDEEEAPEEEAPPVRVKIKSSHDALDDKRLLRSQAQHDEHDPLEHQRKEALTASVRQALVKEKPPAAEGESSGGEDEGTDFDSRMRQQVLQRMRAMGERPAKPPKPSVAPPKEPDDRTEQGGNGEREKPRKANPLKVKPKREAVGSVARAAKDLEARVDLTLMSPLEQQRAKYKHKRKLTGSREEETLAKLTKFQVFLSAKKPAAAELADDEDVGWVGHTLKFSKDQKGEMDRNDDPNQYVVLDPLLEKGKEKFNKVQARAKRRNREWGGGPGPQG